MDQKSLNFQSQNLVVDWISFKSQKQNIELEKKKIAHYFYELGFNSYQKQLDSNQSRQDINNNNSSYNQFEVYFENPLSKRNYPTSISWS